jgi:hypothetical protein
MQVIVLSGQKGPMKGFYLNLILSNAQQLEGTFKLQQ